MRLRTPPLALLALLSSSRPLDQTKKAGQEQHARKVEAIMPENTVMPIDLRRWRRSRRKAPRQTRENEGKRRKSRSAGTAPAPLDYAD